MIDISVLARRCAVDGSGELPSVLISDLATWTLEAVEASSAQDALIDHWAHESYQRGEMRAAYGLQAVAHKMLTKAWEQGRFKLRLYDGERAWIIPRAALAGWYPDGRELEMTWLAGRIWEFDAVDGEIRAIAELNLPLVTTASEAAAFKEIVMRHISEVSAWPIEPPPTVPHEARDALVARLKSQARWPLREALTWVAVRDDIGAAEILLTSAWVGDDALLVGNDAVEADIDYQRAFRPFIEEAPSGALMEAVRNGAVDAFGLFEGRSSKAIESFEWEHLEFRVFPGPPRSASAACRIGQAHGAVWFGHYTELRFDREQILAAFPPTEALPERAQVDQQGGLSPDWWPRPGEQQQLWVVRPSVVEEAERRRSLMKSRTGKPVQSSGRKLCEAMAEMAGEAGAGWDFPSIDAARRNA